MNSKLFVFRHAETFDKKNEVFSGWRDSKLTSKGILEAKRIADQLAGTKKESLRCEGGCPLWRCTHYLRFFSLYMKTVEVDLERASLAFQR